MSCPLKIQVFLCAALECHNVCISPNYLPLCVHFGIMSLKFQEWVRYTEQNNEGALLYMYIFINYLLGAKLLYKILCLSVGYPSKIYSFISLGQVPFIITHYIDFYISAQYLNISS